MILKGIYPIVPTPFDESGLLDLDSIVRLTKFMTARGVNGLAVLGALGESHKLDADERMKVIARFKFAMPKTLSLVVGVRASATRLAIQMAQKAEILGANAILLGPLSVQADPVLLHYYEEVAKSVKLPIIIHDYPAATGIKMSPELIADIHQSSPNIEYIKIEDPPTGPKMASIRRLTGKKGLKVFGALGGLYAFEELDRGAVGIMTGFAYPELLVELFRRYTSGDVDGAAELFYDMLPLNRLEFQQDIGVSIRKKIFVRRGVFQSDHVRHPGAEADDVTMKHIFRIVDHIKAKGYVLDD